MAVTKGKTHTKVHHKKPAEKHAEPKTRIADVFMDDEGQAHTSTSHRRPVVVEIENADLPMPEPHHSRLPAAKEVVVEEPQTDTDEHFSEEDSNVVEPSSPIDLPPPRELPDDTQVPDVSLPSFFESDMKGGRTVQPEATMVSAHPQSPEVKVLEQAVPQAFVGEIEEISQDVKNEKKKFIGVIFIIIAVVLISLGLLVVYAKSIQEETVSPSPTPAMVTPSIRPVGTPTASGSATPVATQSGTTSASASGQLSDLKKKVKVDVLNGTTISGLAAKQAAIVKKEGYVTGTVGNGDATKAGTIVFPVGNRVMAADIQKLLSTFTFTLTEDAKVKTVIVTLGQPKE